MAFEIEHRVMARLRDAERVVILTGSGVSTESGVPSFRECQVGEWADLDPVELASPQGFLQHPRLVWDWHSYRRQKIEATQPGPSHYALVDLEQYYADFLLITQSIDGLHWRAGSRDLLELHGNISRMRCFECGCHAYGWDEDGELPPRCAHCGGMLRPDIVWLGEGLPAADLRRAYQAAERAQVFLSIGASAQVRPAASLPVIAKRAGAFVIEINPDETALAVIADYWMQCKAGEVLPELVRHLQGELSEL